MDVTSYWNQATTAQFELQDLPNASVLVNITEAWFHCSKLWWGYGDVV